MGLERLVSLGRSDPRRRAILARWQGRPAPAEPPRPGLELLLRLPARHYKLAPRGINRVAATAQARALAREAARSPDFLVRALAYEDLGDTSAALRELAGAREAWQLFWRADIRRRRGDLKGFAADVEAALLLEENAAAFRFALSPTASNARLARMPARRWWELAARAEARRSPEGGDPDGGIADLRAVVKARPRSAWAWAYLGRAIGGVAELRKAVDLSPRTGWLHAWLGAQLRRDGRLDEALARLEKAIELDPDYELSYAWRGGILLAGGRAKEALDHLELACELDPHCAWAARERARAMDALGFDSRRAWRRAYELEPRYRPWKELAGKELEARIREAAAAGRHDAVEEMATWWLERRSGGRRALELRAEARRCLGRHDLAAEDFARLGATRSRAVALRAAGRYAEALELAREPDLRAECLRALGRAQQALRLARRPVVKAKVLRALGRAGEAAAALRRPRDAKEHGWAGLLALEAGDKKRAALLLSKACALDPQCAWTRFLLGVAKADWTLVESAVRLDSRCSGAFDFLEAGRGPAWLHAWLGAAARAQGRLEEAELHLDLAACASPWWRAWRGELRLAQGRAEAALDDLEEPPHADAWAWRGRALCAVGRCAEAQDAFDAALRLDKSHVWALIGAGVCAQQRGRARQAARLLERAKELAPALWSGPATSGW